MSKISTTPLKDKADEQEAQGAPDVSELMERIGRMEASYETLQRQNEQLLSATMAPTQPDPTPEPGNLSFDGLPDPIEDTAAWQQGLNDRINALVESKLSHAQTAQQTATANEQRYVDLWNDFQSEHSEWADRYDLIEFAAGKLADRARRRGIDVERYMFATSNQFFSDVIAEAERIGGPVEAESTETEETKEPADRSEGIFGGADHGQQLFPNQDPNEDDDPGDLVEDILDMQRQSGYF